MAFQETVAQVLRTARHSLFGSGQSRLALALRASAFRLLYRISGGNGRFVRVAGEFPMYVEWERIAIDFEQFEAGFTLPFGRYLAPGMTVFDVGASFGEWSVLAATRVGTERVHVFEPNLPSWRKIKTIFDLNRLGMPKGVFQGFAADMDRLAGSERERLVAPAWPEVVEGVAEFEDLRNPKGISSISLDSYCRITGAVPDVIKIDVEGAEGPVLRGAIQTLRTARPAIFLSLHPWLLPAFGDSKQGVLDFLEKLGYQNELLATDHEEHWLSRPRVN